MTLEESLIVYARALAASLKETNPNAEARLPFFETLLTTGLYCPECWVRNAHVTGMHERRRHITCGEHDFTPP